MTISFKRKQNLRSFQEFIEKIYALPDDRLYSLEDLLVHQQRFTMRALKGIRKGDGKKIETNLLIAFSWLMAIMNRLHIDLEPEIWRRFPGLCPYCGKRPCVCKTVKPKTRKKIQKTTYPKPYKLSEIQRMFQDVYPSNQRTLAEAGVHLAEEMGELSEAVHNYLGQHKANVFDEVKNEAADYTSCLFGVANSSKINVSAELEEIYYQNCHVCHKLPCICSFVSVSKITT
jgi:NTP pyrophosphatase (non-canonical NTP hydrolase)